MTENKYCGTCIFYNGETGDKMQFCDEKEVYVSEKGCCVRYRAKEKENESEN